MTSCFSNWWTFWHFTWYNPQTFGGVLGVTQYMILTLFSTWEQEVCAGGEDGYEGLGDGMSLSTDSIPHDTLFSLKSEVIWYFLQGNPWNWPGQGRVQMDLRETGERIKIPRHPLGRIEMQLDIEESDTQGVTVEEGTGRWEDKWTKVGEVRGYNRRTRVSGDEKRSRTWEKAVELCISQTSSLKTSTSL